jgi:hypothetical protein
LLASDIREALVEPSLTLLNFWAQNWLKLKIFEKMAHEKRLKAFFGKGSRKMSERTNDFIHLQLVMF